MAEAREVIRCPHCRLNQFMTVNLLCRRCKYPLTVFAVQPPEKPPEPEPEPFVKPPEPQKGMTEEEFKTAMDSLRGITIGVDGEYERK